MNYREILRLISLGYSQRQIASSVHSSRRTICEVMELADKADIHWPLDDAVTNEVLWKVKYYGKFIGKKPLLKG